MKYLLIAFLIIGLIFAAISYFIFENRSEGGEVYQECKLYQGPIPQGYDEDYFRSTGVTQPLSIGN